jgi:hypothetical protein
MITAVVGQQYPTVRANQKVRRQPSKLSIKSKNIPATQIFPGGIQVNIGMNYHAFEHTQWR